MGDFDLGRTAAIGGTSFPRPPGKCMGCGGESDWRRIMVNDRGREYAAVASDALMGWQSGNPVNWGKVELRPGLQHSGWLEYCNRCEPQPHLPQTLRVTADDIKAHSHINTKEQFFEHMRKELGHLLETNRHE